MLSFVWGLAIIWNTATILEDKLEDHKNDEWTSNQYESSLQNYTMSDLQVRLYDYCVGHSWYKHCWEYQIVFTTRWKRLFCLILFA